jgi:hypothetical protein
MADKPTPPPEVDQPGQMAPPPPLQVDPKLITYIERDQRPERRKPHR